MSRNKPGYHKEYYLKNKESIDRKHKEWRDNNKTLYAEINKERFEASKDGYHKVYLLEDYNYVGCTNNLIHRFYSHKSKFGRDCRNHKVLFQSTDRDEALQVEAQYHEQGYEGKHANNSYN